ncbi:mannan-binding lectin serine protease 1 isoform X3 [Oryzias latipes]
MNLSKSTTTYIKVQQTSFIQPWLGGQSGGQSSRRQEPQPGVGAGAETRFLFFSSLLALGFASSLLSVSQMYGSLESPNFPEPYPHLVERRWNVRVPLGFRIQLSFSHFNLEPSYLCEYDYVKVEAEGGVLALFCGTEKTDTEAVPAHRVLTSPKNTLSVLFVSDFSNEGPYTGFRAHYSATDVDECSDDTGELPCDHFCHNYIGGYYCSCRYGYRLHFDNHTCTVECRGVVFRERSGVLSSVDFPGSYPKNSNCSYRIEVEEGFKLRLHFDPQFDVEDHPEIICPYDYIKVEAGSKEYGPFCGGQSPGLVQTDTNVLTLRFHSDDSGENFGWRLNYSTTGTQCPVPETPPHGVLEPVQSEYFFKDHILFTCVSGYCLMKDGAVLNHYQVDCGANGSWSGTTPRCHRIDCGRPQGVDLADVVFGSNDNSTLFGATIAYVCRGDSGQPSNISFRCGPTGKWTDPDGGTEPPSCHSACGQPSRVLPAVVKRIVGGQSAASGLFPWQALLSVEDLSRVPHDRWFGSGALLSDLWVLTAAHVLRSHRRDPSVVPVAPEHVKVFLGLHRIRDKHLSTGRLVNRILLHPHFEPSNYNNDIALLRLGGRVEFSSNVRPVCLPPAHRQDHHLFPPPNTLGVVAGWGIFTPNASTSTSPHLMSDPGVLADVLQYVKLPVVSQDECRASYASRSVGYNITDSMFCAGFPEGGRDTCLGDSGGAFVIEDEVTGRWGVFGLVSWGGPDECGAQRMYGVYTRVGPFLDWIQNHLRVPPQ